MSPPPYFETPAQELAATQEATEELLQSVAAIGSAPDAHTIDRLERLAGACALLAYSNGLAASLSDNVHFLISWCDHLDDPQWTANFMLALKSYPLRSPW
jgi:hypothetical protein